MSFVGLTLGQMAMLFGALGGAMVLLYILKLRRKRVEVPFSPLWEHVVVERASSALFRALKRLLSLLLQLTMLALVVLALGNPRLAGFSGCGYSPPEAPEARHTLVIVDASASMASIEQGETRLDRARAEALKIVDGLERSPGHLAMVAQLDARVRPLSLWTGDTDTLRAAVRAVAPAGALDTATAVDDALAFARSALRGRQNAEVVLVTDGAFDPPAPEGLELRVVPVGGRDDTATTEGVGNIGIEAFNVRPYLDDSLTYAIFYAIGNETGRDLDATLFLYADEDGRAPGDFVRGENLVASYDLHLPASGRLEDTVGDISFEGSRLAARIAIAPDEPVRDAFARDDVALAVVPERKKLKVQLVTAGNLFLYATLFVRENVDFTVVEPAEYRGPEGFDVTVVDGVAVDMSRPGAYFVLDPQDGAPFPVEGVIPQPEPAHVDAKHPILRKLALVDLAIAEAAKIARQKGDQVVASDGAGDPLLFVRSDPEGQRLFVCLTFDVKKSLLPLSYAFPLLVVNVLSYFHQEAEGLLKPNRAGVELSLAVPLEGDELTVRGPPATAEVRARRVGDRVHLATERIGIYELRSNGDGDGDEATFPIAVNLMDRDESKITPRGEYAAWVPPEPVVREDNPWLEQLWRILLVALLVLFALEWITYNRRVTV